MNANVLTNECMRYKQTPVMQSTSRTMEAAKHRKVKLPRLTPITTERKPKRNAKCSCGSGDKFKRCCGKTPDAVKPEEVTYGTFQTQYTPEQQEAERRFVRRWGFTPSLSQLQMSADGDIAGIALSVVLDLAAVPGSEPVIHAVSKFQRLITSKNRQHTPAGMLASWDATLAEYEATNIKVTQTGE